MAKEAVVLITAFCWVDTNEVASALVFQQCFQQYITLSLVQVDILAQVFLLYPIQIVMLFDLPGQISHNLGHLFINQVLLH